MVTNQRRQGRSTSFALRVGTPEVDDVKLKQCDGCNLVSYCSDACQELHFWEHAGKCRKRAAELRDVILFKQPESTHQGHCSICCLPLPFLLDKSANCFDSSRIFSCCSKMICEGCCFHSNRQREIKGRLEPQSIEQG